MNKYESYKNGASPKFNAALALVRDLKPDETFTPALFAKALHDRDERHSAMPNATLRRALAHIEGDGWIESFRYLTIAGGAGIAYRVLSTAERSLKAAPF